jgi:antitoxin MazE
MAGLVKTLTRYGNSFALIIDRPVLDLLKIAPDTPLEISTPDGENLTITPIRTVPAKRKTPR